MNQPAAIAKNDADEVLLKAFEVRPFKSHFIVAIKSTAVQRWAAKIARDGNYYTLSYALLRGSSKRGGALTPSGAVILPGMPRQTIYFTDEAAAVSCAVEFLKNLQIVRGVKL